MPREMTRTHVVVPKELLDSVDKLVGRRSRSKFFTDAVQEKLTRLKLAHAARKAAGSLADVENSGWETSESAVEWVRALRRSDDMRLRNMIEEQ